MAMLIKGGSFTINSIMQFGKRAFVSNIEKKPIIFYLWTADAIMNKGGLAIKRPSLTIKGLEKEPHENMRVLTCFFEHVLKHGHITLDCGTIDASKKKHCYIDYCKMGYSFGEGALVSPTFKQTQYLLGEPSITRAPLVRVDHIDEVRKEWARYVKSFQTTPKRNYVGFSTEGDSLPSQSELLDNLLKKIGITRGDYSPWPDEAIHMNFLIDGYEYNERGPYSKPTDD